MRTFLFDLFSRYRRFSESIDVQVSLCNRPWIVFNDGTEKEVYKFREDGSIYIVLSGIVSKGKWEYDPSDKTIFITAGSQTYMVHPAMYENMILALQVDGTDNCAFLIEETNAKSFAPKTYSELLFYFQNREKKFIEEENEQKRKENEEIENQRKKQEEADRLRKESIIKKEIEENRRRIEEQERMRLEQEKETAISGLKFFLIDNGFKYRAKVSKNIAKWSIIAFNFLLIIAVNVFLDVNSIGLRFFYSIAFIVLFNSAIEVLWVPIFIVLNLLHHDPSEFVVKELYGCIIAFLEKKHRLRFNALIQQCRCKYPALSNFDVNYLFKVCTSDYREPTKDQ